ncbi:MAG: energy-coupling factor ABC transporter ATP-binding protein [Oscillospiraceae bacterium]|nr:energy-coupling factor ABC transporter ATP-binding protein [Oscillospiraceae bacterium]
MIDIENLIYTYSPKKPATLNGINLHISKGEMAALVGQNGAGKSTLLRHLNGLTKPTSGKVTVAGLDTRKTPVSKMAKHIGYLFQNPDRQIFCRTVREEIEFGMKNTGMPEAEIKERAEKTAALLGLTDKMKEHPFTLSRGERQRIALAGVLAMEPEVLVLDEPTTGQDYKECVEIMDIITAANKKGATVLIVSHDMEVVCDYAERTIVMLDGKIIDDGKTLDVLRRAELLAGTGLKPPQIIELALLLSGYDEAYAKAYDVDTMFAAIIKKKTGG